MLYGQAKEKLISYRDMLREYFVEFFSEAGIPYPWRTKIGPFRTIVTECLLQRTRASIVAERWSVILALTVNPELLAQWDLADLSGRIKEFGLASRAVRLKSLAQVICRKWDGRVPEEWKDLLSLPGVGPYVAGATRSFGHGIAEGIVDVNVIRVFERLVGFHLDPGRSKNIRVPARFWQPLARELACFRGHREFNYGILDFSVKVCSRTKPNCRECQLVVICSYAQSRLTPLDEAIQG